MKALTIRQPWSGAIAHQSKRVENRTWKLPAAHHGARILIHAAAQPDKNAEVYGPHLDIYRAVIAIATLTGCHYDDGGDPCCSDWAMPGHYHWTLADVVPLPEPILGVCGQLGIWTPSQDLVAAALRSVSAPS
ncbi:hypothetical protein [Streptomyces sp. NPDC017529]|uniref:hypothetical protein n=1 Tax=Streptomyces sp. NPDC017529 TaxID=3365000 RepID=UPI0037A8EE6C